MGNKINWKKASRENWQTTVEEGNFPGLEQIKIGALMRIADSLENIQYALNRISWTKEASSRDFENLKKRVSGLSKSIKPNHPKEGKK